MIIVITSEMHLTVVEAPIIEDRQQDVAVALVRTQQIGEVAFELRPEDTEEEALTEWYQREGCSCTHGPDSQPCCQSFPVTYYREHRNICIEMTRDQLDLVIMGQLSALTYTSTHSLRHSSPRDERRRTTTKFLHHQNSICQKTFTFLHAVGSKHYKALKHHYIHHGLVPRIHGNTGKPTANAFHPNEVLHATNFVISYAEANGVVLPGRIPGYKRSDLQLLPSSMTKRGVWLLYCKEAEAASIRAVGRSTFLALWQKFPPQVVGHLQTSVLSVIKTAVY